MLDVILLLDNIKVVAYLVLISRRVTGLDIRMSDCIHACLSIGNQSVMVETRQAHRISRNGKESAFFRSKR